MKLNEIHIHAGLNTQQFEIEFSPISHFHPIFIVFLFAIFNLRRHSIFDQSINQKNEYMNFIAWSAWNWRDFFCMFFQLFLLTTIRKSINSSPFSTRISFLRGEPGKIFTRSLIIHPSKLTFPQNYFYSAGYIFSIVHFISWNTQKTTLVE